MVIKIPLLKKKTLYLEFPPSFNTAFRVTRGVKYFFFIVAALITLFFPSNVIFGVFGAYEPFAYAWSAMLLVGAGLSLLGVLTKTWTGEFIGLPGIIACLFLYALACFVDVTVITPQRIFLGCVFIAFTFSSIARRQDVIFQKRIAEFEQRVRDGRPGL